MKEIEPCQPILNPLSSSILETLLFFVAQVEGANQPQPNKYCILGIDSQIFLCSCQVSGFSTVGGGRPLFVSKKQGRRPHASDLRLDVVAPRAHIRIQKERITFPRSLWFHASNTHITLYIIYVVVVFNEVKYTIGFYLYEIPAWLTSVLELR